MVALEIRRSGAILRPDFAMQQRLWRAMARRAGLSEAAS